MNVEVAIEVLHSLIYQSILMVAPMLLTSVVIGVGISVVQTVTSIQDQTLTFVPKIFGVGIVGLIAAPWMLRMMVDFSGEFFNKITTMAP